MNENKASDTQHNKVLVIEDDEMLLDLLVTKLTNEGFSARGNRDAKGGFRALEEEKPDIILLDLILPEVDGFEILTRVKADPNLSNIPVLILSNLGQQTDIDRVMDLGACGFMVKANYTLDEIIVNIRKVIAGESIK